MLRRGRQEREARAAREGRRFGAMWGEGSRSYLEHYGSWGSAFDESKTLAEALFAPRKDRASGKALQAAMPTPIQDSA